MIVNATRVRIPTPREASEMIQEKGPDEGFTVDISLSDKDARWMIQRLAEIPYGSYKLELKAKDGTNGD